MMTNFTGKVALITGASAGIGQACARALAEEGARLVLTARRQERLDELKQQAEKLGTQAISVLGDAREESTAKKTVEAAMQTFGQIDILINNTGVGNYKNLVDTSAEEYDDMMDTNESAKKSGVECQRRGKSATVPFNRLILRGILRAVRPRAAETGPQTFWRSPDLSA